VVLTRPVGSARSMQRSLLRAGARCVNLPLLSIRDLAASDALLAALAGAATADAVVFASPNAVRACYRLHPAFEAPALTFAQGPATARALRRRGVHAILPEQGFTSEDLCGWRAWAGVTCCSTVCAHAAALPRRSLFTNAHRRAGVASITI
jgi:uroporphyrinogen-III synthase